MCPAIGMIALGISVRAFREPIASIAVWEGKFEPGQAGCGLPARWLRAVTNFEAAEG